MMTIDAKGLSYKELNAEIKKAVEEYNEIHLVNVQGHRYIGDGITSKSKVTIDGTPGNDMAAFMNGLHVEVNGNGQDAVANTMNDGEIIVHGHVGDTLGYAMRGGHIYIQSNAGYRVGIHMKEYKDKVPAIVIGGKVGDFFGEYMAGGRIIVLGLNRKDDESIVGNFCGTGMHGGAIYIRGEVEEHKLGKEVKVVDLSEDDYKEIEPFVRRFCDVFDVKYEDIMAEKFIKLYPYNKRPYGNLYAY